MPWWISQILRSKVGHLHHALVDLTDPQFLRRTLTSCPGG